MQYFCMVLKFAQFNVIIFRQTYQCRANLDIILTKTQTRLQFTLLRWLMLGQRNQECNPRSKTFLFEGSF